MSGDGCARFLPQAIEAVKEAIALDDAKKFEEAHAKYQHALERFVTVISLREHLLYFCCCNSAPELTWMTYLFLQALKYEKNPSRKKVLVKRIDGYMKRAEQLHEYLKSKENMEKEAESPKPVADAAGGAAKDKDEETSKLYAQLSDIVVAEKPNVPWDKVAGLEAVSACVLVADRDATTFTS